MRTVELKRMTNAQIWQIYKSNIFSPGFETSFYSAIFLLLAPGFTNIYYTFRPNSMLSGVMMLTIPIFSVIQYFYLVHKDLNQYCLSTGKDSEELKQKYYLLYGISRDSARKKEFLANLKEKSYR